MRRIRGYLRGGPCSKPPVVFVARAPWGVRLWLGAKERGPILALTIGPAFVENRIRVVWPELWPITTDPLPELKRKAKA